jgi:hypothetical protein
MIFAELQYQNDYREIHAELLALLDAHFSQVRSGLQGDSWIWVFDGEEKVEIDTFTSMKHQIKSPKAGQGVQKVIEILQLKYSVKVYEEPRPEGHEDG